MFKFRNRTPKEQSAVNRYFSDLVSGVKPEPKDTVVVDRLAEEHILEASKSSRIAKFLGIAGNAKRNK